MSIEIIKQPPPVRKVVAYQHKQSGHVYVLGHRENGGGVWDAINGAFVSQSYETEVTFNSDSVAHLYTPIYKGDKIVIKREITL